MKPADPDEESLNIGKPGLLEIKATIRHAFGDTIAPGDLTLRRAFRFYRKAVRLIKSFRGDPLDEVEMMHDMMNG